LLSVLVNVFFLLLWVAAMWARPVDFFDHVHAHSACTT
jgi:hypothetical protein